MHVNDSIKQIYRNSFSKYLELSRRIGGRISEQSLLLDVLFKLEIDLLEILKTYRPPTYYQEQDIVFGPIQKQIQLIEEFTRVNGPDENLRLVSDNIEIFDWINSDDIEETTTRFAETAIKTLKEKVQEKTKEDVRHGVWLAAWVSVLEEFNANISANHREGACWEGTENLPNNLLLGDLPTFRNTNHLALMQEINQGENIITRILRRNGNTPD
ncbi:unnamed protein product [Callosobruchus maculatus]|uniref:CAP N-terminal domain-containing protein n=1 Tax=Callosobruchus maculatus TaxID=64391 RepID=A0A653C9I6_CALMS|nr:unnamed protein product [Callosobruchus maculatus]